MYKLNIEHDAQTDLKSMIDRGGNERECATNILALLSEMKANQALLGSLLDHGFENNIFNVNRFQTFWRSHDVWRLKMFEWDFSRTKKNAIPYRIIYAYDVKCSTFRILAVVNRNLFNYEDNHPTTQRVLSAYSELGLPIHKFTLGKHKH
jgi:hypothetical protein